MLWRGEPQEGIDGRDLLVLATARTRRGNEALKATWPGRRKPSAPLLIGGASRRANVTKAGAPRGAPITTRGTPCRENPMDAPALRAPVGMVVYVAKGVAKPRTWHAAGGGAPAGQRVCHPEIVS